MHAITRYGFLTIKLSFTDLAYTVITTYYYRRFQCQLHSPLCKFLKLYVWDRGSAMVNAPVKETPWCWNQMPGAICKRLEFKAAMHKRIHDCRMFSILSIALRSRNKERLVSAGKASQAKENVALVCYARAVTFIKQYIFLTNVTQCDVQHKCMGSPVPSTFTGTNRVPGILSLSLSLSRTQFFFF
jgi:hypothetical protein